MGVFFGFLALASAVWSKKHIFHFFMLKRADICANRLKIGSKWEFYLIIHVRVAFTVPFAARGNRGI